MVVVPLNAVRIRETGDVGFRASLRILVLTRLGTFEPLSFLVDSGSAITTLAVGEAEAAGIAVPPRAIEMTVHTAIGKVRQRRRPGFIRVRLLGLSQGLFIWPCHFVEHRGPAPKPALGLAGVLDDLRLIFDGTYRSDAPYGTLTLEPRGEAIPVRR